MEHFFQHAVFACSLVVIERVSEQGIFFFLILEWYLEIVLVIMISRLCLDIFSCCRVSSWRMSPRPNILAPTRSCIVFQQFSYWRVLLPICLITLGKKKENKLSDLHQILYDIVCFIKVPFIKALLRSSLDKEYQHSCYNNTYGKNILASVYLLSRNLLC